MKVAEAQTKKLQAEACLAEIMAKVVLLHERRKLLEENFSIQDVDDLLPLPKKRNNNLVYKQFFSNKYPSI